MKVRIKKSGSIFIGVTVFLGIAAANTGNNLLYILVSAMLSVMLTSGVISILNIRGIRATLIPPPEVFANRPAVFRVVLNRKIPFPSFLIWIDSGYDRKLLPFLGKQELHSRLTFFFKKRGIIDSADLTLYSDFPLGTFVRFVKLRVNGGFTVFPEPLPCPESSGEEEKITGERSQVVAQERGYEEVRDIREYTGEPMKLIHWKVSARKGELMVREMSAKSSSPVIIEVDSLEGGREEQVSRACYLVITLMEKGIPVGLRLSGKEIPPGWGENHRLKLLKELALY